MNTVKTYMLMAALTALALFVGMLLGGKAGMMLAFGFALVMNFGSYWFSDKIVLTMNRARPVPPGSAPELEGVVARLARTANIPTPRLFVMDEQSPNAFATGRDPEHGVVCVTTGLLRILNIQEVEGVLAHEIAHIRNHDILTSTIAATMAGAITSLAHMAMWGAMIGGYRDRDREGGALGALVGMIVAPIAAAMIQMAVSRSREYAADADGARLCGQPAALASALQSLQQAKQVVPMDANPATAHMFIVSPLVGGGLSSLFSTHPRTEERVSRLMAMAREMGATR